MVTVLSIVQAEVIYRRYSAVAMSYIGTDYIRYQAQADFVDNIYRSDGKMLHRGGGATMYTTNVVNNSAWVRVYANASASGVYDIMIYRDVYNTSSTTP